MNGNTPDTDVHSNSYSPDGRRLLQSLRDRRHLRECQGDPVRAANLTRAIAIIYANHGVPEGDSR